MENPKLHFYRAKTIPETEPEQNSTTGGDKCFRLQQNSHLMNDSIPLLLSAHSVTPRVQLTGQEPGGARRGAGTCSERRRHIAPSGSTCRRWRTCWWPNHGRTGTCFPPDTRPAGSTCGQVGSGLGSFVFTESPRLEEPPSPSSCAQPRALHGHPQARALRTPPGSPRHRPSAFQRTRLPEETCGSLSVLTPLVSRAASGAERRAGDKGGSGGIRHRRLGTGRPRTERGAVRAERGGCEGAARGLGGLRGQ